MAEGTGALPPQVRVGRRIAALRVAQHLSVRALARRAGMPHNNLLKIERGGSAPPITTYNNLATALSVDLGVLWGEEPVHADVPGASLCACGAHYRSLLLALLGLLRPDLALASIG